MRMCRLTCCLAVVLVGFVNIPALRAAVEPLAPEWFVVTDIDDYPVFAGNVPTPRNCDSEGTCACISDWISVSGAGHRYVGNAYKIAQTRKLAEFEIGLSFVDPTYLCFSIHRKAVDDTGTEYEKVWVGGSTQTFGTGSPQFYSSGLFDGDTNPELTLEAEYIYALAVSWDAPRAVTAGYKSGHAGDFGEYAFERYVLVNSPVLPGGCPEDTVDPSGSSALAFSARVCLAPEPGACCRVDPVNGRECVDVLETECSGTGSSFHGEGTTCAEDLCNFGACCSDCGTCEDDYTPEACYGEGNLSHTAGATCAALNAAEVCVAITGACCGGQGGTTCTEKCAAQCAEDGGAYRGDGTTCEPNLCVGACCKSGGCGDTTQDTCETFGGTYRGNGTTCATLPQELECGGACCVGFFGTNLTDCSVVPDRQSCTTVFPLMAYLGDGADCPNPPDPDPDPGEPDDSLGCGNLPDPDVEYTGPYTACCLPDGTCINTPSDFCTASWVQGESHLNGEQCDVDVTCTVTKCCLADGDCQVITEHACVGRGGTSTPGEACDPNTCLQPTGACCSADAQCTSEFEADCLDSGGEYQGNDVLCPAVPSELCPGFGACCLGDGTCVDQRSAAMCTDVEQGTYQGDGIVCDPFGPGCPDLRGPCCTATGECLSILQMECEQTLVPAGIFHPDGALTCELATCASTGACCVGDGCVDFTAAGCSDVSGIYQVEGTSCAESGRCDLGACCRAGGLCEDDVHPEDCTGDDIFAGVATMCGAATCELGRCCMIDGECEDGLLASHCPALIGTFEGEGRTCEDVPVCPEAGACCTNVSCFYVVETVCDEMESIYQGDGTSCDDDGRCDLGACCGLPGDTCDEAHTEADCVDAGGAFAGVDTTCEGDTCELGRCCLINGTCQDGLIDAECAEQDGVFALGVECDPSGTDCPPGGACCFPDGGCDFVTEETCTVTANNRCSNANEPCTTDDECGAGYCIKAIYVAADVRCDSEPGLCRRGPCCSYETGTCQDKVIASVCAGPFEEFHESLNCLSISCDELGACCRGGGTCGDDVPEWNCSGTYDTFHPVTACADLDPSCEEIGACCRHLEGACYDLVVKSDCADDPDDPDDPNKFFSERDCESGSVGECDQWGGCCEDWACTVKSEADCALTSGVYLGPGVPCDENICPELVGTCCSLDTGTFEDKVLNTDCPDDLLLIDDCTADRTAYEFTRGVDGDPSTCVPHGPCCLSADVMYVTEQRCGTLGGAYGGDGAVCDLELCAPGSCCVRGLEPGVDAICQERPVQACEFEGGGFLGEGDRCGYYCSTSGRGCDIDNGSYDCDKKCAVGENECTSDDECPLFGCSGGLGRECIPGEDECLNLGICSDGRPCSMITGYCYDAGYCDDDSACSVSGQDCQDGSICARQCRHVPCARETCEPAEKCTVAACARGWCCRPDGTCDSNVVEAQCSGPLYAGQFHVYVEDSGGRVDVEYCPEPEHLPLPVNHCWPRGACCLSNGECVESRGDDNSCADDFEFPGVYAGDWTTCELIDRCVVSACCVPGGGCDMRTRQDCEPTGVYLSGQPDCDGLDCTRGSCCLMEGTCTGNTVDLACSSETGDFRAGDSCTQACRPRGACCLEQGECEDNVVPQDCADVLNTFHFASRCDDVGAACTTSGACCLAGGVCTVMEYVACNDDGGSYTGHGSPCDPMPCCPDADPSGVVWTDPPAGVIDARQPRKVDDGTVLQGIDTIEVNGPGDANAACWTLCETQVEGSENSIAGVVEDPPGAYTITLERRITPGAVTKITYTSWSGATEETGIFTSLPGDSGADGTSGSVGRMLTGDILKLVACCLNQSCTPPFDEYSCDIDHSGAVTGADALRLIDLLNGSGEFLRMWDGQSAHDDGECP